LFISEPTVTAAATESATGKIAGVKTPTACNRVSKAAINRVAIVNLKPIDNILTYK
jgi:hypothetical protein